MNIESNICFQDCTLGILTSRTFFGPYNETNDKDPESDKGGIRSHNWFTAFFLSFFDKITTVKTAKGEILYLNTNSLNKWLARHKPDTSIDSGTIEARINNICQSPERRIAKEKAELAAAAKKAQELERAKEAAAAAKAKALEQAKQLAKQKQEAAEQAKAQQLLQVKQQTTAKVRGKFKTAFNTWKIRKMCNTMKTYILHNSNDPDSKSNSTSDPANGTKPTRKPQGFFSSLVDKTYNFAKDTSFSGVKVGPAALSLKSGLSALIALKERKWNLAGAFAAQSVGYGLTSITNKFLTPDIKILNMLTKVQ